MRFPCALLATLVFATPACAETLVRTLVNDTRTTFTVYALPQGTRDFKLTLTTTQGGASQSILVTPGELEGQATTLSPGGHLTFTYEVGALSTQFPMMKFALLGDPKDPKSIRNGRVDFTVTQTDLNNPDVHFLVDFCINVPADGKDLEEFPAYSVTGQASQSGARILRDFEQPCCVIL
jgi:hypothetical protein